jgi:hypothetical protein
MGLFFAYLISLVSTFLASVFVLTTILSVTTADKHIHLKHMHLYDFESAFLDKRQSDSHRRHSKVALRPDEKPARVLADAQRSVVK